MTRDGEMLQYLRILEPFDHILAFYDGRVPGHRVSAQPNWVDDGALELGIASYAIVDGNEALVYDTHISLEHAGAIREELSRRGVDRIVVVLSHWHLDHVAGNAAFKDCEIIASARTAAHMQRRREAIEAGTLEGPPAITPLVMPTRTYEDTLSLRVGRREVTLMHVNIHSDDATVLWLPRERILLAGDTVEDTITYVDEPEALATHLTDLDKLWALAPYRVLPCHGDPDWIASGGYPRTLIRATQQYIRMLTRMRSESQLKDKPLRDLIAGPLDMEWITYFAPYERVHRANIEKVFGTS